MKLSLSRQSLLAALNNASVALSSKCANPYGMFAKLTATKGSLQIFADSIAIRAEATVKADVESQGEAMVNHSKLTALLNCDAETVNLEVDGERLKVSVGARLTHLPMMPLTGFPASRPDGESKALVVLDGPAFSKSLNVVCPFAGDGLTHLWNTGLLIQDDGHNMTIAASDGKKLCRVLGASSESKFKASIPATSARSITKLLEASESLTMTIYEKSVRFDADDVAIQIQREATDYPSMVCETMQSLIRSCDSSVSVARDEFISELQAASSVLERDEDGVTIGVSTSPQQLVVNSASKSSADYFRAIDTKAKTPLDRRGINHANLVLFLRSLDCDRVTLYYEPTFTQPAFVVSPEYGKSIAACFVYFKRQ